MDSRNCSEFWKEIKSQSQTGVELIHFRVTREVIFFCSFPEIYDIILLFPCSLSLMDSFPVVIGMCGVNCSLCPSYRAGRCYGCGSANMNQKRISKWKCKIRACVSEKNLHHCGECQEFPCRLRSSLDSRYLKTYSIDLVDNINLLQGSGPDGWLKEQKRIHTCGVCGDLINPYSRECYRCGEK